MKNILVTLFQFLKQQKKTILLIALASAISIAATTMTSIWLSRYHNMHFPTIGTIYTIGVEAYWDQNLTNQTTQIQWGTLYTDTKTNITIYLHSISNIPTTLILKTENWTYTNLAGTNITEPPNRQNYMNLTWNYNNQTLNPDETIETTLTVTVTDNPTFLEYIIQNNITTFKFDITIRPEETP